MISAKRNGELLLKAEVIDATQLEEARRVQQRGGGSLGRALHTIGALSEGTVARVLASALKLEFLDQAPGALAPDVLERLPADFCRQRLAVPLGWDGHALRLGMVDPLDYVTVQDAEFRTGKSVKVVVTTEEVVAALLGLEPEAQQQAANPQSFALLASLQPAGEIESATFNEYEMVDPTVLAKDTNLPPIVRLVNLVLSEAAQAGASDLHVEPQETSLLIRRRVDGLLQDAMVIPKHLQDAATSRLKIMSGMDIAERRRPQDGRCRLRLGPRHIDLRVSTLPTQFGEKVVIRLLDNDRNRIGLDGLAFAEENLRLLKSLLTRPQGMILVTGPTGSGKTSTLYAALNWVKSPTNNVVSVEDPIEARIPGINQVQINARAGVTFASGLRSILRQDPDVILVGEIRDQETATIAIEAAQTGHLLLSTLHTNDAASTITRLLDLGIEPFLLTSSLIGVLSQRLVRCVCSACAAPAHLEQSIIDTIGREAMPPDGRWMRGSGCPQCNQTGYRGRIAIHELMVMNDELRGLIGQRAPDHAIKQTARKSGMCTMLEDGVMKAGRGDTTLDEVVRLAPVDHDPAGRASASSRSGDVGAVPEERTPARPPVDHVGHVSAPLAGGHVRKATSATAGSRPRVLIVEDSPTIVSVVQYFLELDGFEVNVAQDGESGLQLALSVQPDVVVTDLNMPGMDGLTLVKTLRGDPRTSELAILMLTSETSIDREAEVLEAGADDYLTKPVEPRRLAARVRALLSRRRGATSPPATSSSTPP